MTGRYRKMPLTDTAVRNAKPKDKPYKLSDFAGLYLLIRPSGSKLWRYDYSFFKKRNTLALGSYPVVSLADARRKRDNAKELLSRDIDPSAQRKLDRLAAQQAAGNTFELVVEDWLSRAEIEGRSPATLKRNRYCLKYVLPTIGKRPISEITAPEILIALRKIEARGRYETARRTRSLCGRILINPQFIPQFRFR